ncbi:MAG: aminodeoxychorismate/anthranilate synthase component II [Bacillota bacterium]|nr:aminodeoxychorismate/anthranilate synthase component II [Bacillota bacterium]MDW7684585.1 aminodeoxychorismate/anthranilate synthase component II [Bacillota bacterium]
MIAVIDNYDSFTYNLVQMLGEMGAELQVLRNDRFTLPELTELGPQAIVVSPGPGMPDGAGLTLDVISCFAGKVPILGVCLGHQAIGQCFGGEVVRGPKPFHGKPSEVYHCGDPLFAGVGSPFTAGRYHSLILKAETLPDCFEITARTEDGIVMALRHKQLPLLGVQFHPESVITPEGKKILQNFLRGAAA